jgi:hypothetical protein
VYRYRGAEPTVRGQGVERVYRGWYVGPADPVSSPEEEVWAENSFGLVW